MGRYRGQKALYEVIGKNRARRNSDIVPLKPKPVEEKKRAGTELATKSVQARWLKPRAVQCYGGKVELTLSYPVACVCLLGVLVSLLVAYQLGRWQRTLALAAVPVKDSTPVSSVPNRSLESEKTNTQDEVTASAAPPPFVPPPQETALPILEERGNVIAILTYRDRTQLVPVQDYFNRNGISTRIVPVEIGGFILCTVERFRDNPARPGSDGYARLQQIIELGAEYRPPDNYLGFTRESFAGAHGVLFE